MDLSTPGVPAEAREPAQPTPPEHLAAPSHAAVLGVETLLLYLIGDRTAIAQIARTPSALWLGLVFVLSAGFAREYDAEDLLHEPWYLVLPLGASLLSSGVLFLLSYDACRKGEGVPRFLPAYRAFLTLFWMTAPLAWLYAIPYERLLTPPDAMRANLLTLGVVSVWRVLLMMRVLHVLMGFRANEAIVLVMAFADAVALVSLCFLPVPIIEIMSGSQSESEQVLQGTAQTVLLLGTCSAPVWVIGFFVVLTTAKPRWGVPLSDCGRPGLSGAIWGLAAAALAIWVLVLPFTQPQEQRRRQVERLFHQGRVSEAVALMSAHTPDDFPLGWDPPPRLGSIHRAPEQLNHLLLVVVEDRMAPWVRRVYIGKLTKLLLWYHAYGMFVPLVDVLQRIPEGPALARILVRDKDSPGVSTEERASYNALIRLADKDLSPLEPDGDGNRR